MSKVDTVNAPINVNVGVKEDNMDIITVLRDMIDVRDRFKTCAYYTHNDVEDVINDICLN